MKTALSKRVSRFVAGAMALPFVAPVRGGRAALLLAAVVLLAPMEAGAQFAVLFNASDNTNAGGYSYAVEGNSASITINAFPNTGGGQPTESASVTCTPEAALTSVGKITAGDFRDSADATTPSTVIPTVTLTWTVAELQAGTSNKRCTFYTYDDALMEDNLERIVVRLAATGAGASIFTGSSGNPDVGELVIADNDANTVTLAVSGSDRDAAAGLQVHEGDIITATVTLLSSSGGVAVTTGCLDFGGTAAAGTDFAAVAASVGGGCTTSQFYAELSAGRPIASDAYRITDDSDVEDSETITLALGTIIDFLQTGDVAHATVTANPAASSFTVTILDNDEAAAPADGTITFAATGDNGDRDADTGGLQVNEGDTVTLTVTANGLTTGGVSIAWGLAQAASATYSETSGGGDFYSSDGWSESSLVSRQNSQRLNAPAATFQTTFTITSDTEVEAAEPIVFSFGTGNIVAHSATPSSWSYGPDLTITILDTTVADATATLSASVNGGPACTDCRADEGDSVTITLTMAPESGAIGFNSQSFGGTATQGQDYSGGILESGIVVWNARIFNAASGYSISRTYTITDDTAAEPDETITLEVPFAGTNPGNLAIAYGDPITITIPANDEAAADPALTIAVDKDTVTESATATTATFIVSLAGAVAGGVATASYTVSGTADAGDYDIGGLAAAATMGEIVITAGAGGAGSGTISLGITDDSIGEGPETLQVNLVTATGAVLADPSTAATIINRNDVAVGFERTSYMEREDIGQLQICVDVTAPTSSQPLNDSFSLAVSTRANSAGGGDYTAITNQIVGPFTNSLRRQCFTVAFTQDTIPENTENFFLDLAPPPGESLGGVRITPSQAAISIGDDDAISIGWAQASRAVSADEGAGTVVLTAAILSPAAGEPIERDGFSVGVSTVAGSAAAGDDYTALQNDATIGPFSSDSRSATVAVTITDDSALEPSEGFTARLGFIPGMPVPPNTNIPGATADAAVTILDNEPAVTVAAAQERVDEGGTAEFHVLLRGVDAADTVTASYTVTGAAGADDYDIAGLAAEATGGEVVITAGAGGTGSATIALAIGDDSAGEGPETLQVNLVAATGAEIGDPSTAAAIINRSDVRVGFSQATYTQDESVGQFQACVGVSEPSNSQPLDDSFSLAVRTRDDTAGSGDFTAITNQAAGPFTNNRRQECFIVEINDDTIPEDTETFFLDLTPPPGETLDGLTITPSQATVRIEDNDAITVGWAQASSNVTVSEASGTVVLTAVVLSPAAGVAIERADFSLAVNTMDGSAGGGDYTALTNAAIGPFGDTARSASVSVAITDDATGDALAESFTAILGFDGAAPANTVLAPATATVTITDDDPLAISLAPVPDGTQIDEDAGGSHTFRVGAGGVQRASASVVVSIGGDADLAGGLGTMDASIVDADGNALDTQFTLNLAAATQAFTVQVSDDNRNEGAERITVELSQAMAAGGAVLGAVPGAGIAIAPSDPITASVVARQTQASEDGDAGFLVTLQGGVPTEDVIVHYDIGVEQNHTSNGASVTIEQHPGRPDFLDRGGRELTFTQRAAGATGVITLNIHRDGYEEGAETLTLTLTDITAAGPASLAEPSSATVEIASSGAAFRVVRARLGGVSVCPDAVDGFFGVPGSPATLGTCTDFREHVITLPQARPDGALVYYEPAGASGVGAQFARVTVDFEHVRGEPYADNMQNDIRFAPDDAESAARLGAVPVSGADRMTGASGSVSVGSYTFSLSADRFNEGTETFVLQIDEVRDYNEDDDIFVDRGTVIEYETPVFGSFGIAAFRGMILDHPDDTLIASVADAAEPVAEGATASFTVTIDGATATADTTLPYTASADVTGTGVVTIPQGETTAALVVTAVDDDLNEGLEEFAVQLQPGARSAGAVALSPQASRAVGLITTSDEIFIESLAPAFDGDAMEGDVAEFVVAVNRPSADEFTLRWMATVGGAQPLQPCSGADLCFVPGAQGKRFITGGNSISAEVTFAAGATTAAFSFIVNQDNLMEGAETLLVEIDSSEVRAGPGAGVITPTLEGGSRASANLNIAANDAAMRFLTAGDAASMRVREGDVASFDVALSGTTPASVVTVRWAVDSDAGADPNAADAINMAESSDYAPASGTLRFTPDNYMEPQTAFITITDDDLNESTETVMVRLFGTMGGVSTDDAAIAVSGVVVMNIRQSDPLTWSLTETPPAEVAEDAGDLRYEITLSGRSEGRITVPLVVSGTATAGAPDDAARDVALPPPTMTVATTAAAVFAIGETRAEVTLTVHDDSEFERPETIIVELPAAAGGGDVRTGPATRAPREADYRAITTIRDNDNAVLTLARSGDTVAEGGSAAFTAALDGVALALDVEIDYSVGIVAQAGIGGAQNTAANPDFTPGFTPGADTTGTLVIAAGTTQTTLAYRIVRDGLAENDETLQFELHPQEGGNVSVRGGATTSTVVQSLAAPARLSAAPAPGYAAAVAEGEHISWRIEVAPTGSTTPETLVLHYAVVDSDGNAAVTDIGADIGFADGRVFGGVTRTEVGHIPATQTFTLTTPELTIYRDGVREDAETLFLSVSLGVTATIPANQQAIETLQMTLPLTDGRADATLTIAASDRPENGPPAPLLTTLPAAPGNTTAVVVMEGDVLSVGALLPGVEIPRDWRIGFTLQSTGPGGADLQNDLDLSALFSEGAGESFFPVSITGTSVVTATLVGSVLADVSTTVAPRYTTAATLLIPVVASDGIEEDESFLITLTNPSPSLRLGDADTITRLVTIRSPEAAPELADLEVTITPPDGEVIEGDDAVFTITVANEGRTQPVEVEWQLVVIRGVAGRADVPDIDFTAVRAASSRPVIPASSPGMVIFDIFMTIAPTASAATLVVPITDDAIAERAETVTARFLSASGGGAFRRAAIGRDFEITIAANDARLQIRRDAPDFLPAVVAEGETARFIVSPIGGAAIEANITAAWQVLDADGTASADWNPAAGSVTLTPANPEQTIELTAVEDGQPEPREDFTVQLPAASTGADIAIARSVGAANLVSVRAVDAVVTESAAQAVFVVEVARRTLETPAMITLAVGGDATAGDDYTAPASTTLELPAGVDRAEFPIALMDDVNPEYDETITLTITAATDADGNALPFIADAATVTVRDDDRDAVSLALAGPFDADGELLEAIAEGATATLTLTATGLAAGGAMRVTYTFNDLGDAAAVIQIVDAGFIAGIPSSFEAAVITPADGFVTLTDAAPQHTFVVFALTDNIDEPEETFTVRADSPAANGADPITVAIAADDVPGSVLVTALPSMQPHYPRGAYREGDTMLFSVRLPRVYDDTVWVPWRIAGVAAFTQAGMTAPASADDFAAGDGTTSGITEPGGALSGVLVFAPGEIAKGVTVHLRVDGEAEERESFELRVDTVAAGLPGGGAGEAAVATIFAGPAGEMLPPLPVFAAGDGSVALTGPRELIESETGEWTAVWTGAPSAEAVTMSVVFNGVAGLRRRVCLNRSSNGEFIGCTLIESEAAREDADVIFQQPLSSTMRSIVFNAPVRYGDRVSFRVKARFDVTGGQSGFDNSDGRARDSDGNEINAGGETDEAFTLHLEDAGGSRRSNAAVTTIKIPNIGYIDGPVHLVVRTEETSGYDWNQLQNPELQLEGYRFTNFGFRYRVEAPALGGPITRECQIATPADFGGAFPVYRTTAAPGRSPSSSVGTTTDGGMNVTVRGADFVLADSGPCATKYFRVVQDPVNEGGIATLAGGHGRGGFWENRIPVHIEPTRLINCGGDGSGCGGGAEPSSWNAPVAQLVSISRMRTEPQAGFLIARLGGDVHPNPNRVSGAAKGDAAAVTGQYLELLHDHYSGGRLVEGTTRRFTVTYYGTTLSSPVTVPWHIEGIADAGAQFERAAGFVTFPAGLAGGAIGQFGGNVEVRISGGALTFPNGQFGPNIRGNPVAQMAFIEGGPIEIQRGIDITPRNDAITEGEQSFRVVLGEPMTDGPALAGAGEFAEGVIAASDPIRQVLLEGPAVLTAGQAGAFTVTWGGPAPVTDTSVQWQISGAAADLFSPAMGTVSFAQGDDADQTFTLTPMAAETTRTFSVSLTPMPAAAAPPDIWADVPATLTVGGQPVTTRLPTGVADSIEGYAGTPGEFTVAQSAAPAPTTPSGSFFQLTCPDSVAEGEAASCTLARDRASEDLGQRTIMRWAIAGTGTSPASCNPDPHDFTSCNDVVNYMIPGEIVGDIDFSNQDTTGVLSFQARADGVIELDEEFTITVTPRTSSDLPTTNVFIVGNNPVVRIRSQIAGASLAARNADVGEGGDIAFAITLARATTAEVSVAWQVRGVAEGGRAAVELADLGDGAGGSLGDAQDGDEFTFGDVRGFVSTGTATTILTGTAVFAEIAAVGTQAETLTLTLPTINDAANEAAETLEMVLPEVSSAAVAGYVIVGADGVTTRTVAATITLHDNDTARISIERADTDGFVEGPAGVSTGTRTAQFRVRADGGPGFRLATTAMVSVLVSGAAPGDFEASTDTLMLAPGTAGVPSATLVVTAVDNDRNEPPRTLLASLGRVEIAGAFEYTERVEADAVLEDDDAITATLTPPEQTVEENGAATLTLELDRAAAVAVSVPYTVAPAQTAGATAADFAADAALEGVFELAAGATMASVELAVVIDTEAETTETAVATLGDAVVPAGVGAVETTGMATVRIAQNGAARMLTAEIIGGVVTETDASAQGSFLVDAGDGNAFTANTEVGWRIEHITTSDADFDAVSGTVMMTANISTQTATFNVAGDNLNEGRETFRIHLSVADANADGRTAIGAPATGAVVDDDHLGITFRATTGTESVSMAPTTTVAEGSTTPLATILAELTDAVPSGAVTASFSVTGDGVDAGDFDITTPTGIAASATTGTLAFPQGRTTAVIVLSVSDDDLSEGDEVVRVERGAGAIAAGGFRAATASDAAQFTISASDSTLFAVEDAVSSVAEGETARLAVTLSGGALAATATLAWRAVIADQTNTSVRDPRRLNTLQQPDLAAESGVVMVPANSTRAEVEIAIARDGREEDDEEVLVTLTAESDTLAPDPAADGAAEARFVIAANEAAANFLTWSLDTRRAAEGTTATLTMVLSGRPVGGSAVSAAIHLNDAADVEGGAPPARTLADFNTQTVSFVIRDDDLNEGDETLEVSVRASRDGDVFEVLESETTRTIAIPMSDHPTTITAAASRVTPEGADVVFPLTFEGGRPGEAVTLAWSVTATTVLTNAAMPNDFGDGAATSLPMSSLVIEAGARRAEIRVPTFADTDHSEEVEQFVLQLDSSEPGPPRYALGPDVVGQVSGADLIPPSLEALPWVPGQRAIWLVADEDLFVAATHSAAASLPRGTALPGFSVGRGADQAQASAAAAAVTAAYQPLRGIALTLAAPLAEDGGTVFVFYDYPGGGAVGVFDEVAEGLDRNQMMAQTVVVARSINGGEDFDGDGLPDAAEIAAGENPLTAGGAAGLPTVTIGRASPAHFAYSGVRAGGAAAHLGVSAAPPATRLSAWYLSDTFGFEGVYPEFEMTTRRYGCEQAFPARYSLPPTQGGCQPVDWENVRVGVEHRIGWLALNANGLWAVNTATVSNLPEQTVRRVPEVRMDAAQLYANDTQTATVAASHDGAGDGNLEVEFSTGTNVVRIAAGAGGARFVTMTRASATWAIAGVTTSTAPANTDLLWRAGDGVGGLSADSYSLGVVTRTRVDYIGSAAVAPVFGRATLVRGGDVVAALVAGVSGYRLDVRVGSLGAGATVTALDTEGVLAGANAPSVSVADHVASVSFDVPGDAASASTATVAIVLAARNPGGGAATATLVYSVVAAANPLALADDADNDGISDFYDWFDAVTTDDEPRRSYGGAALLPVSVADAGGTTGVAGMVRGHHIRPVRPQHELRIGPATRERLQARAAQVAAAVAASEEDELRYADFAASRFSDNAAGQMEVVYDFEVHGVEPQLSEGGITGGRAGVIIPLSRSFLAAAGNAQLRPVKEAVGGAGAGTGTGDATAPAGTRAFSRDAADGDYGFAQYTGGVNDEDGRCPDADSGAYTLGPGRGDCLLLWVVDGGANDDDGVRNGVIQDPVRIIRGAATASGTRSHSGTIDPLGLLTLLALSALTLLRRRRPNKQ